MKLDLLQLFQFRLVTMGRSRRGRERTLHLQHNSPCVIGRQGIKQKSWSMPSSLCGRALEPP